MLTFMRKMFKATVFQLFKKEFLKEKKDVKFKACII